VDRYLSQAGRLVLVASVEDVQTKIQVARRIRPARPLSVDGMALKSIVEQIVAIMESQNPIRKQMEMEAERSPRERETTGLAGQRFVG
jgi:hypothetical protein